MIIYLIGFMGCGKSTIAKQLAGKLGYRFIDMDSYIEQRIGESVLDIFKTRGEKYFREQEREILGELSQEDNCVIATGGGAVCSDFGIEIIKNGVSIYIKANPRMLTDRILSSKTERPLTVGKSRNELESYITELLSSRECYYNQADIVVELIGLRVDDLLIEIRNLQSN